jgi:selenocysteine lyase/cysteine desulfurase
MPPARLAPSALEAHFAVFRANTIGDDLTFRTPYGEQKLVYADWTASGRLYRPIESALLERFGPYVGNTHSESSVTGSAMTLAYHEAHARLKRHVNAGPNDLVLTSGSGMTGAVNKLQRILGLKAPEGLRHFIEVPVAQRPVVFVSTRASLNHTRGTRRSPTWSSLLTRAAW